MGESCDNIRLPSCSEDSRTLVAPARALLRIDVDAERDAAVTAPGGVTFSVDVDPQ